MSRKKELQSSVIKFNKFKRIFTIFGTQWIALAFHPRYPRVCLHLLTATLAKGAGTGGGSNDPQIFTWGSNMVFFEKIFSGTHPHVLIETASDTRSRKSVFFDIIYNRFVDSSNVTLMILTPPSQKSSRAHDSRGEPIGQFCRLHGKND